MSASASNSVIAAASRTSERDRPCCASTPEGLQPGCERHVVKDGFHGRAMEGEGEGRPECPERTGPGGQRPFDVVACSRAFEVETE